MADAIEGKKSEAEVQTARGIPGEIGYWILFTLVVSLAQLWLAVVGYSVLNKPWTMVQLIGNGSLLFFTTTLTSKTAGDYFKKVKGHQPWATLVCFAMMLPILFVSVFIFALESAIRIGVMKPEDLSPEKVTLWSLSLAASSLIFSLTYTIIIHVYGESR